MAYRRSKSAARTQRNTNMEDITKSAHSSHHLRNQRPSFLPLQTPTRPLPTFSSSSAVSHLPNKPTLNSNNVSLSSPYSLSFPSAPSSVMSTPNFTPGARRNTFGSGISTDMDETNTSATSPLPSSMADGVKADENAKSKTSSPFASQGNISEAISVSQTSAEVIPGYQRGASFANGLPEPKTEHMDYFFRTLNPPAGDNFPRLEVNGEESISRGRSLTRDPTAASVLEDARRRISQNTEQGAAGSFGANGSATDHVAGSGTTSDQAVRTSGETSRRGRSGVFSFLKLGKKSAVKSGKAPAGPEDQEQGDSPHAGGESSAPSVTDNHRYVVGTAPPMEDGRDMRNFATWHRDLTTDFENRRLEGRHEHPLEGTAALNQQSSITSMGIKQLIRSIGKTVKKGAKGFKKVVLHQAQAVPSQVSTIAHGHIPRQPKVMSKKALTRTQRMAEYKAITGSVLPTFGPRVPTPPPIIIESSTDLNGAVNMPTSTQAQPILKPIAGPVITLDVGSATTPKVNGRPKLERNHSYSSLIEEAERLSPRPKSTENDPIAQKENSEGASQIFAEKAFKGW
ncbi:hypothetical protein Dda_4102 [Drechslerella dactyloides]|uniref:Uncharacterized protein n=1 Tax=Drechslerella dactyloides TaxID=74499 RepID=A0AAD6J3K6_DREDA|nr:hypothetical protein Dda_4102 [Drechslerella dactyloides]